MKAKRRAEIQAAVDTAVSRAIALEQSRTVFNVLSIRFADGRGIDVPYLPWKPRETINLPGRYEIDE